jgi:MoxR-like ATPase
MSKAARKTDGIITVTTTLLVQLLRDLMKDPTLVPCILGPAGIGKSAITEQIAQEYAGDKSVIFRPEHLRDYLTDTRLGQMQEEDLTGLPKTEMLITEEGESVFKKGDSVIEEIYWQEFYRCREQGIKPPTGEGMTVYRLPYFFPKTGKSVWFFDEVNRARKGMLQCLFQLIHDRRYFNYTLPPDVRLVFAGNWSPDEAMYQIEELDPALRSRMCMIHYTGPTYAEYEAWGRENGVADEVLSFLRIHQDLIVTEPKDEHPSPNPRTWEKTSRVLKSSRHPEARRAALAGYIGLESTVMLLDYVDKEYEGLPDPANLGAASTTVQKWIKKHENDKLTAFIDAVVKFVADGGRYAVADFNGFARRLPKEFAFSLYKGLHEDERSRRFITECVEEDASILEILEKAA